MSKVAKRAVAEAIATLGHVGMTVETVPWFDEHAGSRAKRVHFNWRSHTIAIDALERRLRKAKPFLKRKIRRMIVTLIGMFSGKRVVDGWIVDRSPFANLAAETWQTNTSRDRAAMDHIFSYVIHPVHVRRHGTQNDPLCVSKIGDQSSVHVDRKHIRHNFTHSIAAEVLKDADGVLQCLKEKWRGIASEINSDTEATNDGNKVVRVARVTKHRVNV